MKKQKQMEMSLEVMFQIPPTVPPVSWADYADVRIMPTSL